MTRYRFEKEVNDKHVIVKVDLFLSRPHRPTRIAIFVNDVFAGEMSVEILLSKCLTDEARKAVHRIVGRTGMSMCRFRSFVKKNLR